MVVEKRSCTGVQRASQTASATRSRFFGPPFSETLDNSIILLLAGGDKSHQSRDIKHAQQILAVLKEQRDTLKKAPALGCKIKEKSS